MSCEHTVVPLREPLKASFDGGPCQLIASVCLHSDLMFNVFVTLPPLPTPPASPACDDWPGVRLLGHRGGRWGGESGCHWLNAHQWLTV